LNHSVLQKKQKQSTEGNWDTLWNPFNMIDILHLVSFTILLQIIRGAQGMHLQIQPKQQRRTAKAIPTIIH
jgi:hypothetical protein